MALCATTALAGQCPVCVCAALAAGSGGVRAGTWCCVYPVSPFPPRVFRPYPRSLVRHSMRSVRSARSVRLPFRWSPGVLFVCVRSRSRGVRSPPPPGGVARASRVVPALGAGRAVPRGPCPSACPAPVPCSVWRAWGGAVRSRFPPTWLGVVGAAAPGRPSSGSGSQGSASRVSRVRSVRAWGLSTGPTACVVAGRRCSLWVWRKGVLGGVPSTVVRGAWCQALSLPRPPVLLERAARVPRPVCPGCGRCGRGDPSPAPQREPLRAGVARCGGGGRASPGGGCFPPL